MVQIPIPLGRVNQQGLHPLAFSQGWGDAPGHRHTVEMAASTARPQLRSTHSPEITLFLRVYRLADLHWLHLILVFQLEGSGGQASPRR